MTSIVPVYVYGMSVAQNDQPHTHCSRILLNCNKKRKKYLINSILYPIDCTQKSNSYSRHFCWTPWILHWSDVHSCSYVPIELSIINCKTFPCYSAAIPHSPGSVPQPPLTPQEEQGPGSSLMGWMKGAVATGGILSRVAEKAKSSVDSMITTLDPQMREFICE